MMMKRQRVQNHKRYDELWTSGSGLLTSLFFILFFFFSHDIGKTKKKGHTIISFFFVRPFDTTAKQSPGTYFFFFSSIPSFECHLGFFFFFSSTFLWYILI